MREQTPAAAAVQLRTLTDGMLAEVERLPAEVIHWIPAEGVWTVRTFAVAESGTQRRTDPLVED